MKIDIDKSTVEIDGKSFPACALICPIAPDEETDSWNRLLGQVDHPRVQFDLYVPLENGAMAAVYDGGWLETHLVTQKTKWSCILASTDPGLYLPEWLEVRDQKLVPGFMQHYKVQEDWLAEWIVRMSRLPVEVDYTDFIDGTLIPLKRCREIWQEHKTMEKT